MTLTLDVSPELARQLQQAGIQQRKEPGAVARRVLEERFAVTETLQIHQIAWESLLDSFEEGDPEEQRTSLAQLRQDLDDDRPGQRRLFGPSYNSSRLSSVVPCRSHPIFRAGIIMPVYPRKSLCDWYIISMPVGAME